MSQESKMIQSELFQDLIKHKKRKKISIGYDEKMEKYTHLGGGWIGVEISGIKTI